MFVFYKKLFKPEMPFWYFMFCSHTHMPQPQHTHTHTCHNPLTTIWRNHLKIFKVRCSHFSFDEGQGSNELRVKDHFYLNVA